MHIEEYRNSYKEIMFIAFMEERRAVNSRLFDRYFCPDGHDIINKPYNRRLIICDEKEKSSGGLYCFLCNKDYRFEELKTSQTLPSK